MSTYATILRGLLLVVNPFLDRATADPQRANVARYHTAVFTSPAGACAALGPPAPLVRSKGFRRSLLLPGHGPAASRSATSPARFRFASATPHCPVPRPISPAPPGQGIFPPPGRWRRHRGLRSGEGRPHGAEPAHRCRGRRILITNECAGRVGISRTPGGPSHRAPGESPKAIPARAWFGNSSHRSRRSGKDSSG